MTNHRTILLVAALATGGCGSSARNEPSEAAARTPSADATPAVAEQAPAPPVWAPTDPKRPGMHKPYDDELARVRRRRDEQLERADKLAIGLSAYEQAIATQMTVAKLTGDYDEYTLAQALLDKAAAVREGRDPATSRAQLDFTLHRMPAVLAALPKLERDAMALGAKAYAAALAFSAKVAMQTGDYDAVVTKLDAAAQQDPAAVDIPRALWLWRTGRYDDADAIFERVAKGYHGRDAEPAAWLDLMRGLLDLDRGRWDDAMSHYLDADADLEGYWLVQEHIAEVTTLKGDLKAAEAMYRDIIARTHNPEFMDALAGILAQTDREPEAAEWVGKARAAYERQLQQFPEASYGHALEHFLEFGPIERALDLARDNDALRPGGEAKVLLAKAELAAGNVDAAKTAIEAVLASPWRSIDLHTTAAEVYEAAGDAAKAGEQLRLAHAIDPHVQAPAGEPAAAPAPEPVAGNGATAQPAADAPADAAAVAG